MESVKEDIIHHNSMFSVKTFSHHLKNEQANLFSHWHEEFEILYLHQGETTYRVNGQAYPVKSGDIVFVPGNAIHEASSPIQKEIKSYCIIFHPNLLQSFDYDLCQHQYITPLITGTLPLLHHIKKDTPLHIDILPHILQILELNHFKPYGYELMIKSLLLLVTSICITHSNQAKPSAPTIKHTVLIKDAIDYIHQNYYKKFEINQLSSRLNITDEHFCRLFKCYTNKRPIEYLNEYRIELAAKQLLATNEPILSVALDCGFENASYFTKKFKEQKGITPKQFRQQHRLKLSPTFM